MASAKPHQLVAPTAVRLRIPSAPAPLPAGTLLDERGSVGDVARPGRRADLVGDDR